MNYIYIILGIALIVASTTTIVGVGYEWSLKAFIDDILPLATVLAILVMLLAGIWMIGHGLGMW